MKKQPLNPAHLWPKERWLPVPGYEKLYLVSDHGKVWCVASECLSLVVDKTNNDKAVKLVRDNTIIWPLVRLVVAQAFVRNDDPVYKTHVGYLNGQVNDNRACNLIWLRRLDMIERMKEATRKARELGPIVFSTPRHLDPQTVRDIRIAHKAGVSVKVIALEYGLNVNSVYNILRGLTWRHVKD